MPNSEFVQGSSKEYFIILFPSNPFDFDRGLKVAVERKVHQLISCGRHPRYQVVNGYPDSTFHHKLEVREVV